MVAIKFLIFSIALAVVSCRRIQYDEYRTPYGYIEDRANIIEDDLEDVLSEVPHVPYPITRVRRQLRGNMNTNPDGSANLNAKLPLAGNDHNVLSAVGSLSGAKNGGYGAAGGGLALENINGHALSVTGKHIPDFGNQLTGAAKVNLLHTDNHNLNANAFATKNMPSIPNVPNFNTYGGNLDYMYKDKIGATLGTAHTDLFKKTDYSAMGNLNLFRGRDSSLDFNAGYTKSVSPFIPNSSWQPSAGLTYSKFW